MAEEAKQQKRERRGSGDAEKLDKERRDPEAALGPQNEEDPKAEAERADLAKARWEEMEGFSAADLELPFSGAVGDPIIVKSNPETPSLQQIDAATSVVLGPAVTEVSVKDADGNEYASTLSPDNAALISQRVAAENAPHPALTVPAWSNPLLSEMTDEEREADAKACEERFGTKPRPKQKAEA